MTGIMAQIEEDCSVLLKRVFDDQTLTFFGEDGNGQHGRSTFPVTATVVGVDAIIQTLSDDTSEVEAFCFLVLSGYDARVTGHAMTDRNLRIALNVLLKAHDIEPGALEWAPVERQDDHTIVLKINVEKLLSW